MNANHPDLLLEEAFRGPAEPGRMPLVDAPRTEDQEPKTGFDWRPTVLLLGVGAAACLAAVYLL